MYRKNSSQETAKAEVSTGQCLTNTSWLIAYAVYGRILESEKRCVIINVIIDLLCLHEHNIHETKFVLLAQLPLQALHPTQEME